VSLFSLFFPFSPPPIIMGHIHLEFIPPSTLFCLARMVMIFPPPPPRKFIEKNFLIDLRPDFLFWPQGQTNHPLLSSHQTPCKPVFPLAVTPPPQSIAMVFFFPLSPFMSPVLKYCHSAFPNMACCYIGTCLLFFFFPPPLFVKGGQGIPLPLPVISPPP